MPMKRSLTSITSEPKDIKFRVSRRLMQIRSSIDANFIINATLIEIIAV